MHSLSQSPPPSEFSLLQALQACDVTPACKRKLNETGAGGMGVKEVLEPKIAKISVGHSRAGGESRGDVPSSMAMAHAGNRHQIGSRGPTGNWGRGVACMVGALMQIHPYLQLPVSAGHLIPARMGHNLCDVGPCLKEFRPDGNQTAKDISSRLLEVRGCAPCFS